MTEHKHVQQLLEASCLQETIDSLHFWGPTLQLSSDNSLYDEVRLTIEGSFELLQNDELNFVTREANDKLVYLITLARQKISSVRLVEPNDLLLIFDSGVKLKVIGDNGQFESWQLQVSVEDDKVLLLAGPGERLSLFE